MRDVHIYHYQEAPKAYRNLSQHSGDEDWVVVLPSHERIHLWPSYFQEWVGQSFIMGWGHLDWHFIEDEESTIVILAHA